MLQFSQLTLDQAVDRVFIQMSQHRTATNLDYGTVAMFINLSIREAIIKTLAFKDFAYISTFAVSNGAPLDTTNASNIATMRAGGLILPPNYVRWKRVILRAGDTGRYMEARYVDVKEFFSLSDWRNGNVFNRATLKRPIFTIWGAQEVGGNLTIQSMPRFYCAPFTNAVLNDQTGTAPTGYSYYTGAELNGFMDAYLAPEDITNGSDTLPVPGEFEELVLAFTMTRCLAKMQAAGLDYFRALTMDETKKLRARYAERKKSDRTDLQAWIETVPGQQSLQGSTTEGGQQ